MEISNIDDFKHLLQSGRLNFLIGSGLSCPYLTTRKLVQTQIHLTVVNEIVFYSYR